MTDRGPSQELPQIPELADEYELVRELGRGGTAVVYLARDKQLGRDVAVKLIRPTYLHDEDAVARLLREARTVGKLQHPNIVMLLATKRLGKHGLALVLQYVTGTTLKGRIQTKGPLSAADAERVLRDIGRALDYAHAQRIVHRDIKPENVYLDEAVGVARLADFGIARAWDSDSGLTLPGTAIGTPAYMSPEQVDGEELDGRSDLFSLGLVGYEMLTGQQPWAGESLYSVIYKQKHEDLPPISDFRTDVPKNLERAIAGAIHKNRDDRWESAGAFLAALAEGSTLPAAGASETVRWQDTPASTLQVVEAAMKGKGSEAAKSGRGTGARPSAPAAAGARTGGAPGFSGQRPSGRAGPWRPKPREKPQWGVRAGMVGAALAFTVGALWLAGGGQEGADTFFGRVSAGLARLDPGSPDAPAVGAATPGGITPPAGVGPAIPGTGEAAGAMGAGLPAAVQALGGDGQGAEGGATLPLPLVVLVQDANGTAVPGAPVLFEVVSGGGAADPTRDVTGPDGTVITRWTLGAGPEGQTLVARVDGDGGGTATFVAAVAGDSGVVRTPAFAEALSGSAQQGDPGQALAEPLALRVLDADGLPVEGASVRFAVEGGGGRVTPPTVTTDVAGVARASWILGPGAGPQGVTAMVDGAEGISASFEATANPPRMAASPTVVTGGTHSCSLRADGSMVCWGGNARGQLGDGSSSGRLVPTLSVQGGAFARAASGLAHVCALTVEGQAFCWGSNDQGQLGRTGGGSTAVPAEVAGSVRFTDVRAGLAHTCGLGGDGFVYCWGANESGQLGDGTRESRAAPTRVASNTTFAQIAVGWRHTCGLNVVGQAYCWGASDSGQAGSGGATPTAVSGPLRFRSLSAGNTHTCGVTVDNEVACWGANESGQLGDGTSQGRPTPSVASSTAQFSSVTAGGVHTCALTADGAAYCWGANIYGQLGDGTTQARNTPVPVTGFNRFSQIEAFGSHNCARSPGGDVLCWGYNVEGQLGDGTRENRLVPTPVSSARP